MTDAGKTGLTKQEAMKRVSEMDVTKFNDKAAKAVKEKDFSPGTNEWLKVYNLKMKVSRLELLKSELALDIQNLTAEANEVFDKARYDELTNEFQRQSVILGNSATRAPKRIEAILDADFYGQKFSDRVWGGLGLQASLQRDVFGSLNRIYTDMMGYKQERNRLAKKFGTSRANAQRLLKTEIARINADTQLAMFKENKFTHLIFVAEPGACDLCGPLDGKAIPIDKVEKGVNMFPMHPNCRCFAYGHIDMKYKAGGSTLDREATNGVWGEDDEAEVKQESQKQIAGERQKLLDFNNKSDKINYEEASQKLKKTLTNESNIYWNEFSDDEKKSLKEYSKSGYAQINSVMRGITVDDRNKTAVDNQIKNIKSALSHTRLNHDLILYRGVGKNEFEYLQNNDNFEIFTSTSLAKEVANFMNTHVVKIKAPKEISAFYYNGHANLPLEDEVLIAPGQKFRILNLKDKEMEIEFYGTDKKTD